MLRLTSRLFVAGLSLTVATSMATSSSVAQNYPSGPIKLVVPFSPGGGTDVIARSLTQRLSERLGRSVVIENRSGASGLTGALSVAQAKPDGYTLLLTAQTPITIAGHFTGARKAPYDPMTDLKAVALLFYAPVVLLAKSTFPARSLTELVQYAKRNPGSLSYGVAGVGNELHLAWEALRNAASLDVLLVPYQGTGPAMRDVIAGHVSLFMTATSTVKGYLDDGMLRGLAVFSDQRLTQFPSISTVKESGFPDLNIPAAWFGVFAPANTPDEVVIKLYHEIEQISVEPAYRQQMALIGIEPTTLPPDAFARIVRQNHAQWGELIKSAKIKVD